MQVDDGFRVVSTKTYDPDPTTTQVKKAKTLYLNFLTNFFLTHTNEFKKH